MDRYFHDAQWVRKHWDLDVDFDTDSEEEDTTFESDSLEKEEGSEKTGSRPQLLEQQPILDEKDERIEGGGAQGVGEEEVEGLLEQQQKVVADEEETNLEAESKEIGRETREPAFSDR